MTSIDVFRSDFRLPARVCILAPGPNGRGHYSQIPSDYQVITVSKAVTIGGLPPDTIWMMCHANQPWFEEANAGFRGLRIFGHVALEEAESYLDPRGTYYYFRASEGTLEPETMGRVDGAIHRGTSVSGCALQFAYNFGALQILLCGVDMSGDAYFDGTQNVCETHGDVWHAARRMNLLIRWMEEQRGVQVATLSETKLHVRGFRPVAAV